MSKHFDVYGKTDTWLTPKYITEALGEFDLDPCAHTEMPWHHAKKEYTIIDDGLKQPWKGRVWVNPPFNKKEINKWFEKMVEHKNGLLICSAAFETKRFYKYVWGVSTGVLVMDHRPSFLKPDGSKPKTNSGQPICIIAYDEENLKSLLNSGLGVVLKDIRL